MKKLTILASIALPPLFFIADACANQPNRPFSNPIDQANVGTTPDPQNAQPPDTHVSTAVEHVPIPLVAHAGGDTIVRKKYTNTIDAFIQSYNEGFRVFEFDFLHLSDGTVLVAHDGLEEQYGLAPGQFHTATLQDVQGIRYKETYNVMFAQDIISLLREYPDITIIGDGKWNLAETYKAFFDAAAGDLSVLDRLIPHVGTQEELDAMRATNPNVQPMLAVYRTQYTNASAMTDDQILDFVIRNHIPSVMIRAGEYNPALSMAENNSLNQRYSDDLVESLQRIGVIVYAHTVNDQDRAEELTDEGVGIYTDHLTPNEVQVNRPPEISLSALLENPDLATQTQTAADRAVNRAFSRATPGR